MGYLHLRRGNIIELPDKQLLVEEACSGVQSLFTVLFLAVLIGTIVMSVLVAIPAAFLVSAIVGVLIERVVIRHLYGRPLETLLALKPLSTQRQVHSRSSQKL